MAAVETNHPQQPQLSGSYCDDDPIGSFSQDPIGFAAGDANLYRYVGNGPVDSTDPSGLKRAVYKDAEGWRRFLPMSSILTWEFDEHELEKLAYLDELVTRSQQAYLCDGNEDALAVIEWAYRYIQAIREWDPVRDDPLFYRESLGGRPANGITHTFDFDMYETGSPLPDADRLIRELAAPLWILLDSALARALTPNSNRFEQCPGGRSGKSGRNTSESHTPGRGHNRKSQPAQTKRFQRSAEQSRNEAQQQYENAKRLWESLHPEARKRRPDLNPENFNPSRKDY